MITETEIRDAAKKFKSINDAYWNAVGAQVKIIGEEEYLKSKLHTPWARLRFYRHFLAANLLARRLAVEYMVVAQNISINKAHFMRRLGMYQPYGQRSAGFFTSSARGAVPPARSTRGNGSIRSRREPGREREVLPRYCDQGQPPSGWLRSRTPPRRRPRRP
jgi:hypothetical protein